MRSSIAQTIALIKKDFVFDEDSLSEQIESIEELKRKLIAVINLLLNNDMPRLLHALYRIDVSETKVKAILTLESPENLAANLAELIINRETEKIRTREKYSNQSL